MHNLHKREFQLTISLTAHVKVTFTLRLTQTLF